MRADIGISLYGDDLHILAAKAEEIVRALNKVKGAEDVQAEKTTGLPYLRVIVDRGACCGYGVCAQICPEIFGLDDNGMVVLKMETVPSGLEDKAREGAQACPQSALAVQDIEE